MTPPPKFKSKARLLGTYPLPAGDQNLGIELNNWVISEFIVKELVPLIDVHPFPLIEQYILVAAVAYFKPDVIFEWGTNIGKSARLFYEVQAKFPLKFELYTIDLPVGSTHPEFPDNDQFGFFINSLSSIHQLRGDGLELALNLATTEFKGNRKLFFLDGDHSYDSVFKELTSIFDTTKNACVIVHDTFYKQGADYNFGPHDAVVDFLQTHKNNKIILEANYGLPGITVLI